MCEIQQHRKKPFIQHQAVTAGMGGDHGNPFIQRELEPAGISDRLVLAYKAELISHVAQEGQPAL